ncbi:MAG: Kelch repeat-containing protein [Planctomycetota bacterium]|jgi:hypothetical protein
MRLAALTIGFCVLARALPAGENAAEKVTPIIAPDPAVMRIVNGLGEGCSANLPAMKVTGDLNAEAKRWGLDRRGPDSRDYCLKMCWMPERGRAIFYGANHNGPGRLNDVWEYDLPGNTWVCLYGPDPSKDLKADWKDVDWELAKTGVVRTKRGGPAIIPHSWWNMAYDPVAKAMFTPCAWSYCNVELRGYLRNGKHKPPLWAFYPEKKRWEPVTDSKFEGPVPGYENARQMEYVPELGGVVWTKSAGMWLYRSSNNSWKQLGDKSKYGADLPAREAVMAYLPDRKILVAHARWGKGSPVRGYPESKTYHYSIEKGTWKTVLHSKEKNNPPPGFDARTNFAYDLVGRVCLLWDKAYTKAMWSYDPETVKWTKLTPEGPPPPTDKRHCQLAFYDAARNVFVIPGRWVYRHKRAGK